MPTTQPDTVATTTATASPTRTPLPLNQVNDEQLSSTMTTLRQTLRIAANQELTYYPNYPLILPTSMFTKPEFDIGIFHSDKFKPTSKQSIADERYALAFDKFGNRKPMTAYHFESIRRNGRFQIESPIIPNNPMFGR